MILHLIRLQGMTIFEQLLLEEQLLREDNRNFCILNEGSSPAIVMGISGKPEELIHIPKAQQLGVPVIQRFSGGGTVIIDENTLFITFVLNKKECSFQGYPEQILKWSESLYKEALQIPGFALRENDFVIHNLKCGGNAQYIKKERFLQHTSFLWDFCPKKMESLLFPPKTPKYREGRCHEDFLCKIQEHLPSKETFFQRIEEKIRLQYTVVPYNPFPLSSSESRIQTRHVACLSSLGREE
jgi:lipoate-protein ligase A